MTERMQFSFEIDENNNNNNDSRHSNEDAMIITTTNEDDNNNAVALGGDITPSTMFVERLVNMLVEKKDDDEDETAVGYHVLEVLYKMRLKKEENQTLRDAFHNTDIVLHLCTLLNASIKEDVTFLNQRISEEEIVHKIIALIVTLTYKDRNGHYKEQFVVANCLTLLVEKLKLYPHNESLVELICTALNNISIHVKKKHTSASTTPRSLITMKQRFTDVIHNYDTMKIFYDVLVAYPNKSNIQESLIACIHAYLSIYKNNQSFIRENLIEIGYMDYIYTLLTKCLKNITSSNDDSNNNKSNSITDPSSTPTPSSTSLLKLTLLLLKAMSSEEKQTRIYLRQQDSIFVFSTIINRYHACKTVELRNNDVVDKTNKLSSLAMDVLKIVYDNTET